MAKKNWGKGDEVEAIDTAVVESPEEVSEAESGDDMGEVETAPAAESEVKMVPAVANLHARVAALVKTVRTGPQDVLFALHTVEMLTGRLKTVLPAAIEAAADDLKADLQSLLDTL